MPSSKKIDDLGQYIEIDNQTDIFRLDSKFGQTNCFKCGNEFEIGDKAIFTAYSDDIKIYGIICESCLKKTELVQGMKK